MNLLRLVHRWIGLVLVLPLAVLGLTGALLAGAPLLDMFASAASIQSPQQVGAIVAVARKLAPEGMRVARYAAPSTEGAPAQVFFQPRGAAGPGRGAVLAVDPVSLQPIGPVAQGGGVMSWMQRLHSNFLLAEFGGRSIVGWVGVGMLLLSVIGIPLWWPSRAGLRDAITVPSGASGARLHRALHGATGFWMLGMMLVSSATGAVLGFPQATRAVLGLPAGGPPRPGRAAPDAVEPTPDLDAAIAAARRAAPGLAPRMLILPVSAADPLRIFMTPGARAGAVGMTAITLDVTGTRILRVQDDASLSAGEQALRWGHDLHEGEGLGVVWRLLTVVVGLALPLFGVTGAAMWLLRRLRLRANARRAASRSNQYAR